MGSADWRLWGPYLSERAWGTVRENYSPNGDAWDHVTFDQARAFRWGEDGIAGICARWEALFARRQSDATVFYDELLPQATAEDHRILRQALAGLV